MLRYFCLYIFSLLNSCWHMEEKIMENYIKTGQGGKKSRRGGWIERPLQPCGSNFIGCAVCVSPPAVNDGLMERSCFVVDARVHSINQPNVSSIQPTISNQSTINGRDAYFPIEEITGE